MKKILLILVAIFMFAGCEAEAKNMEKKTADQTMQAETNALLIEAHSQSGMPAIRNFQERKLAKMIFELRDQEKLITYAYIVNQMQGKLVFLGKCIGYGLPYSVQYTSPEKMGWVSYSPKNPYTIPQADPNGLYMPEGLSATWLMMIDPTTKEPRPVYIEPEIIVSPFPLHNTGE